MKLRQIIICLSVGMLSFGMTDSTFATAPVDGIEATKQGKVVTSDIARELIKNMKDGELIIPEEYTAINKRAFTLNNGIKKINLGNVQTIEEFAFYGCANLHQIDLKNVQTIGGNAFNTCTNLHQITLKNVQTIEDWAFYGCTKLEKIDLKNVQIIGGNAFYKCTNLHQIDLKKVQTIEDLAFYGCTSLESITIPDSVTSIGSCAFFDCNKLKSVNVYSERVKQLILSSESDIDESIINVISNDKTEHRELTMQEKYSTELKEIERLKSLLRKEKGGEEFVDIAEVKSDLHLANDEVYMKQLEKTKAQLLKKLEKKNKK